MEYPKRDPDEILSEEDREYLFGRKNHLKYKSKSQVRSRIRDRIRDNIRDFLVLHRHPDERLLKLIARDVGYGTGLYYSFKAMIGFIARVMDHVNNDADLTDQPFQFLVHEALSDVYSPHAAVKTNIEIEFLPTYDKEAIFEKVRNREIPTEREIMRLVHHGDASEEIRFGEEERPAIEWIEEWASKDEAQHRFALEEHGLVPSDEQE